MLGCVGVLGLVYILGFPVSGFAPVDSIDVCS